MDKQTDRWTNGQRDGPTYRQTDGWSGPTTKPVFAKATRVKKTCPIVPAHCLVFVWYLCTAKFRLTIAFWLKSRLKTLYFSQHESFLDSTTTQIMVRSLQLWFL